MAAVAARFVAEWNHDCASFRNALNLTLKDPKLGRIDQVVGGINSEKRRTNFFKIQPGIVIASSFKRVQNIICVVGLNDLLNEFVQDFIRFCERRRVLLT